jgi:aspartate/methionine/tyrosine aminotransferase
LIGSRTRALVVNLPGNPTGGIATPDALQAIAELALRHDLVVISDEVYGRIRYDGRSDSIAALPGMLDRTIIVDSFSKTYNMTGWRLGFGVLPAPLVERVTTLVVNGTSCTPPFVQLAGLAALTGPQDTVRTAVASLERRRDWLVDGLNGLPGIRCTRTAGAFYAFPDVRQVEGGAGHLRLSFAVSPADLDLALDRLRECVSDLAIASLSDGGIHVHP